jgi:hypothetical protein
MSTTLSPAAQAKLDTLIDEHGVDDSAKLLVVLQWLAARPLPPIEEATVKGQGLDEWERSQDEHAAAVELQEYAKAEIGPDRSKALAKMPEYQTLDDFLDTFMPKDTGKEVRRRSFMDFLRYEAEMQLVNDPPPPGLDDAEQWIEEQAQRRFAALEGDLYPFTPFLPVVPQPPQFVSKRPLFVPPQMNVNRPPPDAAALLDIVESYRAWWKRQDKGNPLADSTKARSKGKAAKIAKMIELLPLTSGGSKKTMSRVQWREKAQLVCDIPSRTFDTYLREIRDEKPQGFIESKNRFRRTI